MSWSNNENVFHSVLFLCSAFFTRKTFKASFLIVIAGSWMAGWLDADGIEYLFPFYGFLSSPFSSAYYHRPFSGIKRRTMFSLWLENGGMDMMRNFYENSFPPLICHTISLFLVHSSRNEGKCSILKFWKRKILWKLLENEISIQLGRTNSLPYELGIGLSRDQFIFLPTSWHSTKYACPSEYLLMRTSFEYQPWDSGHCQTRNAAQHKAGLSSNASAIWVKWKYKYNYSK